MIKFKKITIFIVAIFMFSINALAETQSKTFKATVNSENVSVIEDSLASDDDNSNLLVNVIKYKGEQQTLIYSGVLSGYADGMYSDIDFSEIQFLLVFDWETPEDEAIIIEPQNNFNVVSDMQLNANLAEQSVYSDFFRLDNALESEEIVDGVNIKTYDVSMLPDEYLMSMETIGSESGDYGDGSIPAPTITYDYSISQINLRDDEDNSTDCLKNGGVLQSVTVESNGVNDDVILAVAEYNGYTLTKLTSYGINLENNKDVIMTGYLLSNITPDTSIKLFVWDSYWGTNPQASPVTLFPENNMDVSINFLYDNAYSERELKPGQVIRAEVNARSTKWWPQPINLYLALYDESDKLVNIVNKDGMIISDGKYQFLSADIVLPQPIPTGYKIKSFVWDMQSMYPYLEKMTICEIDDYYADSILDAKLVNISKTVNGQINTEDDIDFIKFIPSSTQDYLLQLSGDNQVTGTLYNSNGDIITTINDFPDQIIGSLIAEPLIKGQTYYVGISGETGDNYTLTVVENNKSKDNLVVTSDGIIVNGELKVGNIQTFTAKLISTDGNIIKSQEFSTDANGKYDLELTADITSGDYYFIIVQNNVAKRMWNINTMINHCTFDVIQDEYCIIPITAANAGSLENITFSVCYNATDFELFDACDLTQNIENTATEITDSEIEIIDVHPTYMLFKSMKDDLEIDNNLINIVKLKAKRTAVMSTDVCAYIIQ